MTIGHDSHTAVERRWFLEFESDGAPYVWRGFAFSEQEAERKARTFLRTERGTFNSETARLVACLES
jgi:hypothetical protein